MDGVIMNAAYKRTGLFFMVIFLLAMIVSVIDGIFLSHKSFITALTHPYVIVLFVLAALMLLSTKRKALSWLQPVVWFICAFLGIISGPGSIQGLGFYIIGMLLLFRFGFFETHRILKLSIALGFFFVAEIIAAMIKKEELLTFLAPVFIITVLIITLYLAYEEKLMVYLKEPKETLSLKGKGLTDAEQKYVLAMVGGKSPKEIAFFYEVSESTVRNTLARAYKKLGVGDRSELAALAARVELVA